MVFIEKFKNNQYQSNLLSQIINKTEDMFREDSKSPYKSGIYDLNCSASLYQYKNRVMLLFFGSNDFRKIFDNLPLIDDFHYQDQTDEPENISKKDFKLRGKWWHNVLQEKTPTQSGLSFSLMTDSELFYISPSYQDIINSLGQNIESRNKTIVRALSQKEIPFPISSKKINFSEIMESMNNHLKQESFIKLEKSLSKKVKIKTNFEIEYFNRDLILSKIDKISK